MNKKIFQYYREYRWANIFAMMRNNRSEPEICTETYSNKLVVISGATSGIGYQTARKYAANGANLLCINRNLQKSEDLCREIQNEFGVNCNFRIADLSILSDVFRVSNELLLLNTPIDVLIHNAGVYLTER